MNMIPGFFLGFSIAVVAALVALLVTLGIWTTEFFARNRKQRVATNQPMVRYYRNLGSHAFSH